jgi:hypothetical protein
MSRDKFLDETAIRSPNEMIGQHLARQFPPSVKHGGKVLKAHGNYDLVQAPQDIARKLLVAIMENLGPWRIRSIEAFRDVMLGNGGVIANPLLDFRRVSGLTRLSRRANWRCRSTTGSPAPSGRVASTPTSSTAIQTFPTSST